MRRCQDRYRWTRNALDVETQPSAIEFINYKAWDIKASLTSVFSIIIVTVTKQSWPISSMYVHEEVELRPIWANIIIHCFLPFLALRHASDHQRGRVGISVAINGDVPLFRDKKTARYHLHLFLDALWKDTLGANDALFRTRLRGCRKCFMPPIFVHFIFSLPGRIVCQSQLPWVLELLILKTLSLWQCIEDTVVIRFERWNCPSHAFVRFVARSPLNPTQLILT